MNIIIFGPQGCGKGTQADMLVEKYGSYHLSMGDELRKEIKNKTVIGKKVEKIMNGGFLVPNEITDRIALDRSKSRDAKKGIIFDGYPRTDEQWGFVKKNIKIDIALEIKLTSKESIRRIASRRMCPKCGKNYNLIWLKPKKTGCCDIDGARLIQRDDDKPKKVLKRLKIYALQTEPLKKEFKKIGILHIIDGNQPIKKVNKDILDVLH
jgi:adenylate kinase